MGSRSNLDDCSDGCVSAEIAGAFGVIRRVRAPRIMLSRRELATSGTNGCGTSGMRRTAGIACSFARPSDDVGGVANRFEPQVRRHPDSSNNATNSCIGQYPVESRCQYERFCALSRCDQSANAARGNVSRMRLDVPRQMQILRIEPGLLRSVVFVGSPTRGLFRADLYSRSDSRSAHGVSGFNGSSAADGCRRATESHSAYARCYDRVLPERQ